jgi:hypothetical protein
VRRAVALLADDPSEILEGHDVVKVSLGVACEDELHNIWVVVVEMPAGGAGAASVRVLQRGWLYLDSPRRICTAYDPILAMHASTHAPEANMHMAYDPRLLFSASRHACVNACVGMRLPIATLLAAMPVVQLVEELRDHKQVVKAPLRLRVFPARVRGAREGVGRAKQPGAQIGTGRAIAHRPRGRWTTPADEWLDGLVAREPIDRAAVVPEVPARGAPLRWSAGRRRADEGGPRSALRSCS